MLTYYLTEDSAERKQQQLNGIVLRNSWADVLIGLFHPRHKYLVTKFGTDRVATDITSDSKMVNGDFWGYYDDLAKSKGINPSDTIQLTDLNGSLIWLKELYNEAVFRPKFGVSIYHAQDFEFLDWDFYKFKNTNKKKSLLAIVLNYQDGRDLTAEWEIRPTNKFKNEFYG